MPELIKAGAQWDVIASGGLKPWIAEITNFDGKYRYARKFFGVRENIVREGSYNPFGVGVSGDDILSGNEVPLSYNATYRVRLRLAPTQRPALLEIQDASRGYYVLHFASGTHAQLDAIDEGMLIEFLGCKLAYEMANPARFEPKADRTEQLVAEQMGSVYDRVEQRRRELEALETQLAKKTKRTQKRLILEEQRIARERKASLVVTDAPRKIIFEK
jgi:hypothetical protein